VTQYDIRHQPYEITEICHQTSVLCLVNSLDVCEQFYADSEADGCSYNQFLERPCLALFFAV
jgi:hypothetical protein